MCYFLRYFTRTLSGLSGTLSRVLSLMTEYIPDTCSGIPLASHSPMSTRRHQPDEENTVDTMLWCIWLGQLSLFQQRTSGTQARYCFLMNYGGPVCETEFRRPAGSLRQIVLLFPGLERGLRQTTIRSVCGFPVFPFKLNSLRWEWLILCIRDSTEFRGRRRV